MIQKVPIILGNSHLILTELLYIIVKKIADNKTKYQ